MNIGATLLRLAEEGPTPYERNAYSVSAIIGGTPRVWTEQELLIEGAGIGLNLDYEHKGKVLSVSLGELDVSELPTWLSHLNTTLGANVPIPQRESEERAAWPRITAEILNAALPELRCAARRDAVVVGGQGSVFRVTQTLFGERAMRAVASYFDIQLQNSRRRM